MIVKSIMKTMGSGKTGKRVVVAPSVDDALKKSWRDDARIFIKVFGKDKARLMLNDTIYFVEQ